MPEKKNSIFRGEGTETQSFHLFHGDCFDVLSGIEPNTIDSVVTDPPYGLSDHSAEEVADCLKCWVAGKRYVPSKKGFMGREWDGWVPGPEIWKEVYRVLKPGGHMLVFAGTRSMDLVCMAIRLAGFELRDSIFNAAGGGAPLKGWVYGQGMPKSLNVGKAIEKSLTKNNMDTSPAHQWQGWFSGLKPAIEPIILARKPVEGNIAGNVLRFGCGALNIDACRVALKADGETVMGRYPSNLCHDGSESVIERFPESKGQLVNLKGTEPSRKGKGVCYGEFDHRTSFEKRDDNGSASRFFNSLGWSKDDDVPFLYCPKATKTDRSEGCDVKNGNRHPTVKPVNLCRWLCRLATPPYGIVLDPFAGSGSTGKGALLEGFSFYGIEREEEYCRIAGERLSHALLGVAKH